MNKLLLTLIILAGAGSLHGMEPYKQLDIGEQPNCITLSPETKLSPITLPQTYHQLRLQYLSNEHFSLPEITQHIFSFQLSGVDLAELPQKIEQSCKDPVSLVRYIRSLVNSCGYELASELCKL